MISICLEISVAVVAFVDNVAVVGVAVVAVAVVAIAVVAVAVVADLFLDPPRRDLMSSTKRVSLTA